MKSQKKMTVRSKIAALGLTMFIGASATIGGIYAHDLYLTDGPAIKHAQEVLESIKKPDGFGEGGTTSRVGSLPVSRAATVASIPNGKERSVPMQQTYLKDSAPTPDEAGTGESYGFIENPLFGELAITMGDRYKEVGGKGSPLASPENQRLLDLGTVVSYSGGGVTLPGHVGNYVVTGHRTTHGHIFRNAVSLHKGDTVKVTTKHQIFEYRVIREAFSVSPAAEGILDTDPISPYVNMTQKLMTIITCGERGSIDHREVIVLELVE